MWSNITLVTMLANVSNYKEEELLLVQKQCHFPLSPERSERLSGILLLQRQRRLAWTWILFSLWPPWASLCGLQISVLWSLKKLSCVCMDLDTLCADVLLSQSGRDPLCCISPVKVLLAFTQASFVSLVDWKLSESSRLKKAPHTPACFAEVTCGLKEL